MERCKYLEESKCVGICVNTCKLPTQVSDVPKRNRWFLSKQIFGCFNPDIKGIKIQVPVVFALLSMKIVVQPPEFKRNKRVLFLSEGLTVCLMCLDHFQSFFKDYMGVPLLMEPNFDDYSCQVSAFLTREISL